MVGGSSASQPAPPCSPDEWHLWRWPFHLQSARLVWAYVPVAHILSCEHGAHPPASVFYMLIRRLVHPRWWGSTLVAGVVPPGAVDRLSGLLVVRCRMAYCKWIARLGECE